MTPTPQERRERLERMLAEYEAEEGGPAWLSALGQEDCKRALRMLEAEGCE